MNSYLSFNTFLKKINKLGVALLLTAPQLSDGAAGNLRFGQSHSRATVILHTWRLQNACGERNQ